LKKAKPILSLLLTRNILFFLLLIGILLTSIFIGFEYYYKHNLVEAEQASVISSVRSFFEMGSNILISYNSTYKGIAEEKLFRLSDAYKNGGISKVEETAENISFNNNNIKGIHYYIIEKGIITTTNYPKDKGLNLKKIVPIFWKDLTSNLSRNGDTYIENISYEVSTNKPRVFGYRRINRNTIFEIGLQIEESEFASFIDNLNNLEIKSNIQNIETYNIKYVPFRESFSKLTEEDKKIFKSIKNSKEEIVRDISGNKKILYMKWIPSLEDVHSTINTKIMLDFSKLASLRNRFLFLMLVMLPLISFLMILINYRITKRYLDPLSRKITTIHNLSQKENSVQFELESGIYEVDTLHSYYKSEIEKREYINEDLQKEKQKAENSLQQKELLLKEIHHRVKNNLNIITSLLRLQSSSIEDEEIKRYFTETQNRINSMSLIHEKLYKQDLSGINFKQYVEDLVSQLLRTYQAGAHSVQSTIDAPNITINLDTAIPLGLIINELLTNSLEHGLKGSHDGTIEISITPKDSSYILTIKDNGNGLPENFDPNKATSLGISIVSTLSKQLKGSFEIKNGHENGTVATVRFQSLDSKEE